MPQMPHNIERSLFRRGEYIGYSSTGIWRITRVNVASYQWQATNGDCILFANTLDEMSTKLEETL